MYEQLQIGKIVGVHGVRGELRVIPLTDQPSRFDRLKWLYVEKDGAMNKHVLEEVKYLKNILVIKLADIDSVEVAETLRGSFLIIDRKDAIKLPENSWFICDIIGLEVVEENGDSLGKLVNVLHTGSNDVYAVEDGKGGELLLPALKSVVREVSFEKGKIIVAVPKGLMKNEV